MSADPYVVTASLRVGDDNEVGGAIADRVDEPGGAVAHHPRVVLDLSRRLRQLHRPTGRLVEGLCAEGGDGPGVRVPRSTGIRRVVSDLEVGPDRSSAGRGDEQADVHVAGHQYRRDISELVWDRRAHDKVGPLCRWAVRRVATNPELADLDVVGQVEALRKVLPDNLIGRHALSHIERAIESDRIRRDRGRRPASSSYREARVAFLREQLQFVLDSGRHGRFNRAIKTAQAGSESPVRVLLGVHDLDAFAEYALGRPAVENAIAIEAIDAKAR